MSPVLERLEGPKLEEARSPLLSVTGSPTSCELPYSNLHGTLEPWEGGVCVVVANVGVLGATLGETHRS